MDKKTELEMKKAKLEQIRQRKAQTSSASLTGMANQSTPSETLNVDPDKILIECGITTPVLFSSNSHTTSASSIGDEATPTTSINSNNSIHGQLKSMVKK